MIGRAPSRSLVVGLAVALMLSACSSTAPNPRTVGLTVITPSGAVEGSRADEVTRFSDIPYAAPPVGDLRWAPPAPVAPWEETLDARSGGIRCIQPAAQIGAPAETEPSTTEDCLTLSVTTPSGTVEGDLPVIVWIHGGGFSTGSGNDYDAAGLARSGAVVVTVNYRLGLFGFLSAPGLDDSGTFGLLDQQAALKWVQSSIGRFGGDPDRVTVAGDSAGADSVCAQLASPSAGGLFHAAILQSPGCGQVNVTNSIVPGAGAAADTWKSREVGDPIGQAFASQFGCTDPATIAECLRDVDSETLAEADAAAPIPTFWSPVYGAPTLPRRPSDAIASSEQNRVPVLITTTADEGSFFVGSIFGATPLDSTTLGLLASSAVPDSVATVLERYTAASATPNRIWADIVTDRAFSCPATRTANDLAEDDATYLAEFADATAMNVLSSLPSDLSETATHGSDVPYILELTPGQPRLTSAQTSLSASMRDAWVAFAATGDPSTDAYEWETIDSAATVIGADGFTNIDPAELGASHNCDLWDGALPAG